MRLHTHMPDMRLHSMLFDNGDGPEVAILTEYDALPEIGHGCGHNLHGSLSILTGLALKDLKDSYKGKCM